MSENLTCWLPTSNTTRNIAVLRIKYSPSSRRSNQIIAELIGSDIARACGITAQGNSPVLKLCRKLVGAGHDPATPLDCWRGDVLCLRIRSIGEAAELEPNSKTTSFVALRRRAVRTAPSIAPQFICKPALEVVR